MTAYIETAHDLKLLITVKTYPIPSDKYDELVCTAGVTEEGDFVRLYPINFRDLDYVQRYKKYQWVEVKAQKHGPQDRRKESYRPIGRIKLLGEQIKPNPGNWGERAKYVLKKKSKSIEDLHTQREADGTSLGIFKPKIVHDLEITPDDPEWKPQYLAELKQNRFWETRKASRIPLRKVPFRFRYRFECDDPRCNTMHRMSIYDWEVGALFWRNVDNGDSHQDAAEKVKVRFLADMCGPDKETYFYVGTVHGHPKSWIVLGAFYPKAGKSQPRLF